jgi:hypothetical protein
MIVSDDTTIWSVTYHHHYDDHKSFIIQATNQSGTLHGAPLKKIELILFFEILDRQTL